MADESDIKAVSMRNQFPSLDDIVEGYERHFASESQAFGRTAALRSFAKRILRNSQWALERATAAAIEQAFALMEDPKYREKELRNRKNAAERRKLEEQEQVAKTLIESADPEAVAKRQEQQLRWLNDNIDYHKKTLVELEARRRQHFGMF